MFSPKLYIPSNIRGNKPKNSLITDTFQNNAVSLLDWLGIDLGNGDASLVLSKAGTWVSNGSPTLTFTNGLTKTLNNVQLGGTLTEDITIDIDGNQFEVVNSFNSLINGVTSGVDFAGSIFDNGSIKYYSGVTEFGASLGYFDLIGGVVNGNLTISETEVSFNRVPSGTQYNAVSATDNLVLLSMSDNQFGEAVELAQNQITLTENTNFLRSSYTSDEDYNTTGITVLPSSVELYVLEPTVTGVTGNPVNKITLKATTVNIDLIPAFADDAAAIGGGLVTDDIYKTTTLGSTYLKIVP